jgi:hypothetical protein
MPHQEPLDRLRGSSFFLVCRTVGSQTKRLGAASSLRPFDAGKELREFQVKSIGKSDD